VPKKTKRQVRSDNGATTSAATPTPAPTNPSRRSSFARASEAEFNPDYTYVLKDLRRIGILAGSFFTILIVLAIIIM
jgi:hypothetical protein